MSSAWLLLLLPPQDLIEREHALRRGLSPSVDRSSVKPRRASIDLEEAADFACASFDLKASLRSLFDRNVKEEFLGGAIQEDLAGSALVLACYASPTVCDAIKHYRATANVMLGMELDACRGVEQALGDLPRRSRARAIKECLDDRARRGVPLDRAQEECRRAATLRGPDGRPAREIDLLKDLEVPDALAQPIRIGPGTLRAESRATAVVEAYESRRRECLEAWQAALQDPSHASLDRLGPLSRAEVERVALMEPARRDAVARSLASSAALAGLMKEVHDVERALESGELLASPEARPELERRRHQLRSEIGRLVESFDMERRLNAAAEEARSAAEADVARKARERLAGRRAGEAAQTAADRTRPWGCEVKRERR